MEGLPVCLHKLDVHACIYECTFVVRRLRACGSGLGFGAEALKIGWSYYHMASYITHIYVCIHTHSYLSISFSPDMQ